MTAIVLKDFKNMLLGKLEDFINDSNNNLYIGVGRTIPWNETDTPPIPENSDKDIRDAILDVVSIKNVEDTSYVVPRNLWSYGTQYFGYDDDISGNVNQRYYVMNRDNEVFLCLQTGYDSEGLPVASIVEPDQNYEDAEFRTSDGYLWKYIFTVGAEDARYFMGANYMPVNRITEEEGTNPASDDHIKIQWNIQSNATPRQIVGYKVINGGTGYLDNSPPTLTIHGDGTGAAAKATVIDGSIAYVSVEEQNNSNGSKSHSFGEDYTYASVSIFEDPIINPQPGQFGEIIPIFGPVDGLGGDPRKDLRATSIMFYTRSNGSENTGGDIGDWIVNNDFRQITLINNPLKDENGSLVNFTERTGTPLKTLDITAIDNFYVDDMIIGGITGAKGYVVRIQSEIDPSDPNKFRLWYLQNEDTGFKPFSTEAISVFNGLGNGSINIVGGTPEVILNKSEVLYLDNREPITRDETQFEDIKIIINV